MASRIVADARASSARMATIHTCEATLHVVESASMRSDGGQYMLYMLLGTNLLSNAVAAALVAARNSVTSRRLRLHDRLQ